MSNLGEKIRKLRSEKELTIPDLTKLTGVTAATISDIERGRIANPSVYSIHKIARALQVDISYLLEDDRDVLQKFRSYNEKFQEYFDVALKAFNLGVSPQVLEKMIEALALHNEHNEHNK